MCFSEKASIFSFLVGMIGSILCISLGKPEDKITGYFFAFVSVMQLIEFLLWRHQKCDLYNRVLSLTGMVFNHLQPIVLAGVILYFSKTMRNAPLFYFILLLYLIVIIPYSIQFIIKPRYQCTLKYNADHLKWQWNSLKYASVVYIIFLITIFSFSVIGMPNLNYGIFLAFFGAISYLLSFYFYIGHVGALWCYFVVFYPICYYLYKKILNN
jgi:hypothetical protein